MREVFIAGVGQSPVQRRATEGVRELGGEVVRKAVEHADVGPPTALYLGNMMSGSLCLQRQLGALVADAAGLRGIEAAAVEAACASGAAAMRWGVMAIASGMHDVVAVCGVERMTHVDRHEVTMSLATASDWLKEGGQGETFLSLNAKLTRWYFDRHRLSEDALAPFAFNAHANGVDNPHALFQKPVSRSEYENARVVEPPVRLFDVSPICDGAAAVILCSRDALRAKPNRARVRVLASSMTTDSLALEDRRDPLVLEAAVAGAQEVYRLGRVRPSDIDFFELHDAYSIMCALSLEAAGFAAPGRGYELGASGAIRRDGEIPIATLGGLKARGHPVGATGVYQIVEAFLQLAEEAGDAQVEDASIAMTQNFGGTGATVVTHLLDRVA